MFTQLAKKAGQKLFYQGKHSLLSANNSLKVVFWKLRKINIWPWRVVFENYTQNKNLSLSHDQSEKYFSMLGISISPEHSYDSLEIVTFIKVIVQADYFER